MERKLIWNLYRNQSIVIRIKESESEGIRIEKGVRQGCCLSPILFNIYLEEMLQELLEDCRGVGIGRRVKCIRFADDMALLAENEENGEKIISSM